MADELAPLEDEYRGLYLEVTEVKLLGDMNLYYIKEYLVDGC